MLLLGRKGISPFHREAGFADLRGIRWGYAGELRSDVVDDVEIAVWTIVVPQPNIGAHCLRVRCVHLNQTGES